MTLLQIMSEHDATDVRLRTTDPDEVATALAAVGVRFDRWEIDPAFDPWGGTTDDILTRYAAPIGQLQRRGGYQLVDVARLQPDASDPQWEATAAGARAKFLDEHAHAEDEVRFFAAGRGCFFLRLAGAVHAVVGEAGDLLSVPAGTLHWFDMGSAPRFVAVRFFEETDGWVGQFTGDAISSAFPTLDELMVTTES